MRSRQINFFLMPEDLIEINEYLKSNNIIAIKQPILDIKNIISNDVSKKNDEEFGKIYLTLKKYINKINIEFIDTQNYYLVNDMDCNVIEFSRGGFFHYSPNELKKGRLYFVTHYYNKQDEYISKDEEFIKWGINFMRVFKRKFLKCKTEVCGYGTTENVLKWMKENNKLMAKSGLSIK